MSNYKLPPRQKMINLLYVILIAMLAINISGEVLDGFATANQDMKKNVETLKVYNGVLEKQLAACGNMDAVQKAAQLKKELLVIDENIMHLEDTIQIVAQEGSFTKGMNVDDDLNAVEAIMLHQQNASELKVAVEAFRKKCLQLTFDETSRKMIGSLLNTDADEKGKSWEERHFANLPVIGCKMMMSKIQKDLWLAFNETLRCVNERVKGNDSLMPRQEVRPVLDNNLLEALVAHLENRNMHGQTVKNKDGHMKMLVMTENQAPLFANYENLISVTALSESPTNLEVSLSNGSIRKEGSNYIAVPDGKEQTAVLTVKSGGKVLARYEYKVMPLPTPVPSLMYIASSGRQREYRSNVPLSQKEIQSISRIKLNMEGGVNTQETVTGFDLMLIKGQNQTVRMAHSNGAELTPEMKQILTKTMKGDKLIFTNISVKGKHTPVRQTVSVNVIPM